MLNAAEEHCVHVTKENQVIDALKANDSSNQERKRKKYADAQEKPVKTDGATSTEVVESKK